MCRSCYLDDAIDVVENASPVIPARKKGKWIQFQKWDYEATYYCSECSRTIRCLEEYLLQDNPYCHCGAEMEVEDAEKPEM